MFNASATQRFQRFADVRGPDDCWPWMGEIIWNGYGRLKIDGHKTLAHRFAYSLFNGAIGDGLQIDHLCRNRACVNPRHLEPVTNRENVIRGNVARRA